jgi:FMN-dependent oxidoreductase (nitrilotriacetate monooxygenase family)
MNAGKKILLNAFNMNCVGHINHGLWTHPRDNATDYHSLDYWIELARLLEHGLFDGLFIADIVGVYDVYQQSVDVTLREAVQLPVNDPLLLVPAMAAATRHLGFGVTANLSYEPPYLFARRMSTLDHLSQGRAGWNVVTGYLDSAARAMGLQAQEAHDRRYDRAEEYLELVYKLWEGSWEDGAVRRDRAARIYADPARVHKVRHAGEFYRSEGYHLSEPSPQRTPVLFQAGTSGRGQQFAARHAEGIFIGVQDKESTRKVVQSLRDQALRAGRQGDDLKIFAGISVIVGRTAREAEEKLEDYWRHASPEAGLAHFSSSVGVDFGRYGLDDPVDYGGSNAIVSAASTAQANAMNKRKLLERFKLGSRYPTIVGDAQSVADQLESWVRETDIDGFNLARTVAPECYADFIELVVPELQNRGSYKTAYAPGTFRHKLFGGGDRLPERHAAHIYRRQAPAQR